MLLLLHSGLLPLWSIGEAGGLRGARASGRASLQRPQFLIELRHRSTWSSRAELGSHRSKLGSHWRKLRSWSWGWSWGTSQLGVCQSHRLRMGLGLDLELDLRLGLGLGLGLRLDMELRLALRLSLGQRLGARRGLPRRQGCCAPSCRLSTGLGNEWSGNWRGYISR